MSSGVTDESPTNAGISNPSAASTLAAVPASPIPDPVMRGNVLGWVASHPATILLTIVLVVMGIFSVCRHSTEWDEVYLRSAKVLLEGKNFYREFVGFTYPPFPAWVTIPFVYLPTRVARGAWFTICAGSLVYLLKSSWRLAGGPRLEPGAGAPAVAGREIAASLIGHVIALQFALNALTHLQPDLPIAAMLMAGCAAIGAGRFMRGATWIGVAAAFKATPLLFAPYLLWRRQWRAGAWLILVTVAANLLPNTVHAPPGGGLWLTRWYTQYLKPMAGADYRPGDWKNLRDNNQAIAGAVNRWMATTWKAQGNQFELIDRPDQPGPLQMKAAFGASCLAMLLPIAWAEWARRRRAFFSPPPVLRGRVREGVSALSLPSETPLPRPPPEYREREENSLTIPSAVMIECGIVFLLMVLFSPNSSRAHFCVMYLPAFCLARLAVRGGAEVLLTALHALAAITSTLSIHVRLPGSQVPEQLMLWVGVVMLSSVFLLLACCRALAWYPADSPSDPRIPTTDN